MRETSKLDSNALNDLNIVVKEVDSDATGSGDTLTGIWATPLEALPDGWELNVEWAK